MVVGEEIDQSIRFIDATLEALEAGGGDLGDCVQVHKRFRTLRDQYRQQPGNQKDGLQLNLSIGFFHGETTG